MSMNIIQYFSLTNKGIVSIQNLPPQVHITNQFFGISLGLEMIFLLVVIGYFSLSVYRSMKKIKNPRFQYKDQQVMKLSQTGKKSQNSSQNSSNTNFIFRFDDSDQQRQNQNENQFDEQNKKLLQEQDMQQADYQKFHDEYEEKVIQIDDNLVSFQPFLVAYVICVSTFTANMLSLVCMVISVGSFMIFNLKGDFQDRKQFSLIFMIPSVIAFIPILINDMDMST